jgi:hypothetical protein
MTAAAAGRRAGPGAPGAAEAGRGGGEERRILVTPRSLTRDPPPELAPLTRAGYELVLAEAGEQPDEAALPGREAAHSGRDQGRRSS